MTYGMGYYRNLKTYRIVWPRFELGFELSDVQRMVYNEAIIAKQEIVDLGPDSMIVRITESVADTMKKCLKHYSRFEEVV